MSQVRIFVSHSHQDNEWCRPFVTALKAVGYDVWYDETGLTGGAAWIASIQHEVQTRDVFLLVLTPEAWESKWVQDELQLAIATRRRILPMLLRNTQVDGFLLTTQWVTVVGDEPPAAARSAIMAIEAPPAPGKNAAPQAQTETLDDLATLCRSLITEQRYTEALATCSRGLAIDPASIEMLRLRGWVLLQINEPKKAAETWARMLSLAQSERVVKLAQEMVIWLRNKLGEPPNYPDRPYYLTGVLVECLATLISQLASEAALREIFNSLMWGAPSGWGVAGWDESSIRTLISGVRDASVLRMLTADYVVHNALENGNDTVVEHVRLLRLLCESCYGYPPDKATPEDIDGLRCYADALATLGDPDYYYNQRYVNDPKVEQDAQRAREESGVVEQYIQRLSR